MPDESKPRRVRPKREPQIPTASRYDTVAPIRSIITALEGGEFFGASRLIRQMWQNPRLRVALSTRVAGHVGAQEQWKPGKANRDGRAAKAAIEVDWPLMMSTATRKQQAEWGLLLGVHFAQPRWYTSKATGRQIPMVMGYDASACRWDEERQLYGIRHRDGQEIWIPSPALSTPDEMSPDWIVHEPFGTRSFKRGYIHAAWYPWLGNNLANRDRLRTSEKVGEDTLLAYIPHGGGQTIAADQFVDGLRDMKGGAVIPCEVKVDEVSGEKVSFDVKPLEWTANGYQVVDTTVAATAVDLVILFLGGNLQTEVKGGGSHGAADSQGEVRADYIDDDAKGETNTLAPQVVARWTEANFGDPDVAPIREVISDPPARDESVAKVVQMVSQSLDNLARHGVDTREMCERFRFPMQTQGKAQVAVPAAPGMESQPERMPAQPSDTPAQENAAGQ
jgi:hypothetical protein